MHVSKATSARVGGALPASSCPESEVGDRSDEVDGDGCRPQRLGSTDERWWTLGEVHPRGGRKGQLNRSCNEDSSLLTLCEVTPPFAGHLDPFKRLMRRGVMRPLCAVVGGYSCAPWHAT
jgi:hypothetical protein